MNVKKILKILEDIVSLENNFNIQGILNNILSYYNQNQPDQLNEQKNILYKIIEDSVIYNYVGSDLKVLKSLEMLGYFDSSIKEEIEGILSSQSHEIQQKITNFIQKRSELFSKVNELRSALDRLNIKSDLLDNEHYYIIFSFPSKYEKVDQFEKGIHDINLFLSELISKQNNNKRESYKISAVDNGCIEIFIETGKYLANHISFAIDCILKIYELIILYEDGKKRYSSYEKKRKEIIAKAEKEETDERKDKLLEEFINSLDLNEEEDKTRIRGLFLVLVKHFESGMMAEVKTPYIDKPEDITDTDTVEEKKNKEEQFNTYKINKTIEKRNKDIYNIQNKNQLLLDLPFNDTEEKNIDENNN